MSESNPTDHWSQLASEIGAEPVEPPPAEAIPPSPSHERVPEPFSTPFASRPSPEPSRPPRIQARPSWDALAKELGIEAPPEPPEPPKTIVEEAAVETAEFAEDTSPDEVSEETSSEAIDFISREEAETLLFGGEGPPPLPSDAAEAPPAGDHKRRRRKHRDRNRDRPARPPAPSAGASEERPAEAALPSWKQERGFEPDDDIASDDTLDLLLDEDVEESAAEERIEPPPRRRGHRDDRKRKRRHKADVEPSGKRRPAETGPEAGSPESDIESFEAKYPDADLEEEEEEQDAQGRKSSFRSIPTWSEAIGVIVAKNMESRGKRSSNGGPPRGAPDSRRRRR